TVTITGPRDGATIYGVGIVLISATATDNEPVRQVEFFVDGASIGVDTSESNGWSAVWNPTRATIGSHTIRAVATDSIGQTAADSNEVIIQAFTNSTDATTNTTLEVLGEIIEAETPAQGLSATGFSLAPPTLSAGAEIILNVTLVANVPGTADIQFLLDGEPLGGPASVTATRVSDDNNAETTFSRSLPTGIQIGLHRIELVTTDDPPRVLASRTVGVVAGTPNAPGESNPLITSSTSPGLIVAIVVGGAAALAATGFGMAGWYRRRVIVQRLSGH
ncbi:MAG: Ig-like domain-containing protein, partial [Acidimicrobiia bacterium]|nr:Ig-like domain-containing protein [Acidimicrobiia bacterium]